MSERSPGIIEGELHRVRHGRRKRFAVTSQPGPVHRPARVAVTLALAHRIRQEILSGEVQDQAAAARNLGLTRARLTQILDLANLAPDLQEEILFLEAIDGREPLRERALRGVVRVTTWADQRSGCWDPRFRPTRIRKGRWQQVATPVNPSSADSG